MKLMFVHADYVNYQVKEKARSAEEIPWERRSGGTKDSLITFACVERMDEKSDKVVEKSTGRD